MGKSLDRAGEAVYPTCAAVLSVAAPRLPKPTVVHGYPRSKLPQLVGLTRRQIAYLAERGLVLPSARGASGRGRATLYSWQDLLVMATLRRVLEISRTELGAKQAATVIEALRRDLGQEPLSYQCLVVDNESAFIVEDVRMVTQTLEAGRALLLVPLRSVESELESRRLREGLPGPPSEDRQRAA
jgi:DNA-binding transcriptional MerR regulator